MGSSPSFALAEGTLTADSLLAKAQERNHVFHIFLEHGYRTVDQAWKEQMGEALIVIPNYQDIPKVILETIMKYAGKITTSTPVMEVAEVEMIDGNAGDMSDSSVPVVEPEDEML